MEKAVRKAAGLLIFRVTKESPIEYLFLQASYGTRHWTPPKGHAEEGESLMTTALRETEEETHLKPNQLRLLDIPPINISYLVKSRPKEVSYFLAELVNPDQPVVLSEEHQAYKWCDFESSLHIAEFEEMKSVLRKAKDILSNLFQK